MAKKETDGGSTNGKQSGGFSRMHLMTVVPGLCSSFCPSKSEEYRRRLSVETDLMALCAFILAMFYGSRRQSIVVDPEPYVDCSFVHVCAMTSYRLYATHYMLVCHGTLL